MQAQRSLAALVPILALSACASPREVSPLIAGEFLNIRMALESGTTDLAPPAWGQGDEEALPTLNVQMSLLAVEPSLAERVLGERATGLVSLLARREQVEAALAELRAAGELSDAELQNVTLTLRDGQTGNAMVVQQEAYIQSFELVVSPESAIADPQVGVLNDGLLLVVTARADEGSDKTALDFALTLAEYERPFKVREIELVGAAAPVQIQVPEGLVRRLNTSVDLGPEEVLVIGGSSLPVQGDRVLLAFVAVEPVGMEPERAE